MSDDPMADFLAREKAALGEDADFFNNPQPTGGVGGGSSGLDAFPDFDAPPSSSPAPPATAQESQPQGLDAFPDFDAPPSSSPAPPAPAQESQPQGIDAFPSLDSPAPTGEVRVTGYAGTGEDEDREKFESAFPDLSSEVPQQTSSKPVYNALAPQPYGASPYPPSAGQPQSQSQGQPRSSILPAPQFNNILPTTQEDTEPIKAWREKQAEEIKRRDEQDRKRRDEMSDRAEKWIDGFYEDYNKVKERNIRENKENEAAFVEKLQESIAKGSSWERVTELIQLENSQSKTIRPSVPGGSDLARMKEILLALRREGDKAPGAAGF